MSDNLTKAELQDRDAIEALADAWASIDGKVEDFRAGKGKDIEAHGGHYAGYLADAEELMNRLLKRGFTIVPVGRA